MLTILSHLYILYSRQSSSHHFHLHVHYLFALCCNGNYFNLDSNYLFIYSLLMDAYNYSVKRTGGFAFLTLFSLLFNFKIRDLKLLELSVVHLMA